MLGGGLGFRVQGKKACWSLLGAQAEFKGPSADHLGLAPKRSVPDIDPEITWHKGCLSVGIFKSLLKTQNHHKTPGP